MGIKPMGNTEQEKMSSLWGYFIACCKILDDVTIEYAVVLAELFLMFLGTHLLAGKVNHAKSVGMQDQRLLN